MYSFYINGLSGLSHVALSAFYDGENRLLVAGFLARSKTAVTAMRQSLGSYIVKIAWTTLHTKSRGNKPWKASLKYNNLGRDHFTYCLAFNPDLGDTLMLTDAEDLHEDVYNFLMEKFSLPLLKEWIPAITERLGDDRLIDRTGVRNDAWRGGRDADPAMVPIHGRSVSVNELVLIDFSPLTEEALENVVGDMIKSGKIRFCEKPQKPLEFKGLDEYFNKYGTAAIKNLHESIDPLTSLKANVKNLALKNKSLFPQQAATVEGIVAMEAAGKKYAVVNHGMGCGKTIEAASACEAIAVGKWIKSHPGKTLRDAYEKDGIINYRVIVMAPGHLVEKWGQEVRDEIPYAKVTTIHGLRELQALQLQGRKPCNGKEFFVISKDKAKLGTQLSPTPVKIGWKPISLDVCRDCAEEDQKISYKSGVGRDACCPTCKGKRFKPAPMAGYGKFKGMICPHCGELLLKYGNINPETDNFRNEPGSVVLGPKDFASPNKSNSACYHCGGALWGVNAAPLLMGGAKERKSRWKKISHYANYTKKSKVSAFVLKGHEDEYLDGKVREGMTEMPRSYGPRKVAPAAYVKKYLKGYFDFCILDEAHKYLGESAQAVGAHALIKASKFTMALTGTISNGTATCFYNLFFMLEPKRLINMGFNYGAGDRQRFCREYGCVEQEFGAADGPGVKNAMSRGKALGPAKVKPGISPVLFGALLMDCSLFMDISDLSKYLPRLKESVRVVPMPDEIVGEYKRVLETLKQAARGEGLGMSILAQQLQFGLTFPDKPFGRGDIMHPFIKDSMVCRVNNFDYYAEKGVLLPKEEELVDIVNEELSEGRNCFVYATATNGAEACVTERLKAIIEDKCNLHGRVEIIQSSTPAASEREAWFHKRAAQGIKVFITNPRCVETGLDFCFKHDGVAYNYPTLIFYQTSYELATIWQASRRAYRLSQKEECRTFYLAYSGTLQVAALQIMAKKQVATSAIQGHFSAEGLASMAQGVDARTLLAQSLSEKDMGSADGLADMFDVLAKSEENSEDEFGAFVPSKSFYELVGRSEETVADAAEFEFMDELEAFLAADEAPVVSFKEITEKPAKAEKSSLDDFLSEIEAMLGVTEEKETEGTGAVADAQIVTVPAKSKSKKKAKAMEGQLDLMALFAV